MSASAALRTGLWVAGKFVTPPPPPAVPPCARCALDGIRVETRIYERGVPLCGPCGRAYYEALPNGGRR